MNLILAKQAAEQLSVPLTRLYEMVRTKTIPAGVVVRLGERQMRFNESKLHEWIEQGGVEREKDLSEGDITHV